MLPKKLVHKAGKFIGNKIADAVTKSNNDNTEKQEPVEEIIIPPEKNRWSIKQIEKSIIKIEHYKISKLLNDSTVSKSLWQKKWVEENDLSSGQYSVNKSIRLKTSVQRPDLCDYSDAYIVGKGKITVEGTNDASKRNKNLAYKNNAPFISCISKVNKTLIDNTEDLYIVMVMYNLLKYSENYSITSGSLWNYYRDEINDDKNETNRFRNWLNNNKTIRSKSFE